jgi:hypothetical protein
MPLQPLTIDSIVTSTSINNCFNLGNTVTDRYEHSTSVTIGLTLRERIDFCVCIDKDVTPHFKKNRNGKLIISHSILGELQKSRIDSGQIGSLK